MNITTEVMYNGEWCAIDSDTYDGAPDSGHPVGVGKTEIEAIRDLLELIEESE